jgi:hypothetical protein
MISSSVHLAPFRETWTYLAQTNSGSADLGRMARKRQDYCNCNCNCNSHRISRGGAESAEDCNCKLLWDCGARLRAAAHKESKGWLEKTFVDE